MKYWAKLRSLYHAVDLLVFSASSSGPHARILCLTLSVWYGSSKADTNLSKQIKLRDVLNHTG